MAATQARKHRPLDVGHALDLMIRRAVEAGKPLPPSVAKAIDFTSVHREEIDAGKLRPAERAALVTHYNALCKVVAPATPASLHAIEQARHVPVLDCLGRVPFVRRMLLLAILCLLGFIGVSASGAVEFTGGGDAAGSGTAVLFGTASSGTIVADLSFLLLAAALGASFAQLMEASRYARQRAFDPVFEPGYWATFVLGLLGGLMLSTLIPVGDGNLYTKPLLALIGGFSAKAVYQILMRLVDAVTSVVSGDVKAVVAAQEETLRARLDQGLVEVQLRTARQLVAARQQLGSDPAAAAALDKLIDDLMSRIGTPADAGDAPPPFTPPDPLPDPPTFAPQALEAVVPADLAPPADLTAVPAAPSITAVTPDPVASEAPK